MKGILLCPFTFVISDKSHVATDTDFSTRVGFILARVSHFGYVDKLDFTVDVRTTDGTTCTRVLCPTTSDASTVFGHTVARMKTLMS